MANDSGGKPRFIRKNGKVIPIGGKKKGGKESSSSQTKKGIKAAKSYNKSVSSEAKVKKKYSERQSKFSAIGAGVGLIGRRAIQGRGGSLVSVMASFVGGAVAGSAVGAATKKSRKLRKKMGSHRAAQSKALSKVDSDSAGDGFASYQKSRNKTGI